MVIQLCKGFLLRRHHQIEGITYVHVSERAYNRNRKCVCVCVGGGGGVLLDVFFCLRVDECITGVTVL